MDWMLRTKDNEISLVQKEQNEQIHNRRTLKESEKEHVVQFSSIWGEDREATVAISL